jgi:ABC transporter DrrB family efflux protein
MISSAFYELIKCRWREFRREPSAFFFVLFMPLIWMIILGLAFSNPHKIHTVGVPYLEKEAVASVYREQVISSLSKNDSIQVIFDTKEHLQKKINESKLLMMIDPKESKVLYYYDPTNIESNNTKHIVNDLIQVAFGRKNSITVEEIKNGDTDSRYIDFLIPGLLALSLLTTSLYGTGMVLVASRREKLLKRYRTTPMSSFQYISSHIVGRYMIMAVEFLMIGVAGYFLFDFTIRGNFFDYIVVSILGTTCFTSIALLCGSRVSNVSTYNGIVNLIVILMMLLSGVWFSKNIFPLWLNEFSSFLPLSALVGALRKIALEGVGLLDVWFEMLILSFYMVGSLVVASRIFKWY